MTEDPGERKQVSKNHSAANESMERVMKAKQSYWPFALAASLTLTLVGVILMSHPIVFWVGVACVIVSFIGWGMERR